MEQYEEFIKNNRMCDFEQSLKWNKIKTYWLNEQIIVKQDDKIRLIANILIRKIPVFGTIMYIPRGPIGEIENKKVIYELTEKLKLLAKKYNAFVVLMEPDILKSNKEFKRIVKSFGYKVNSRSKSFASSIQARYNLRLNLEDKTEEELLKTFNSKTRYNIKLAEKKGVVIKEKGLPGLDEFYELLKETGLRDNFIIREKEYYKKILEEFDGATILLAYYNNLPIAGIMPLTYGNKTWYLYGASGNSYRNLMPNYLLQWEAIKLARRNNSIGYDFKGCSFKGNKPDGLYRFKKGFGTELVELIGEVNLEIKPIRFHLFKIAKLIYCYLRKIKYNFENKN